MIRGVFFDAGNTIVFPDYSIYSDIVASLGGEVTLPDVKRAEALARSAFDRSVASSPGRDVMDFWSVYYTAFYEHLGVSAEAVPAAIAKTREANDILLGIWSVPVDGFEETMDALEARGLVLGVISNSDGRVEERLVQIGIRDRFEFVIDSAIVGVSKPHLRIFELATEASRLPPSEVAYVGDYYEIDVVGARGAGMTPVLFDPYGAYEEVDCDVMKEFRDIVGLVDAWSER